ncbi:HpcH/HpaI aldolase family protein [Burkholderia cenocepacia]|uniref:HpcH/HpaI aldolase family protein n=1 Tax=Burkholderia cenocepacia TaxID=95486 RepID=UPI001F4A3D19|nr:aldolase/citrate lyase family protein [Burkholderia cenocepacia]
MSTLTNSLKQRLRDGDEPLYGLWLSLGSDSAAEALAHAGYDWLCIDMEHAPNDSRDVASQLRAAAFGMRRDYLQTANAQVAVIVQVESARGVDEVERIAATPGVDCLFVGPADLAASLGHLGDIRHPDVETAMARVLAAGKQAGVAVGIFAGDTAAARQYREAGYRMITVSADVSWLLRATRQALQEVRS